MLQREYVMRIESAGGTHIGKVRENNEDNFFINGIYKEEMSAAMRAAEDFEERAQYLYAICDGMGGEAQGELASLMAVEILSEYLESPLEDIYSVYVEETNLLICEEIKQNGGRRIGTTLALLMIDECGAVVCNIGDSRIYRYREGQLLQLSHDHTRAQQMVDAGILNEEAARTNKQKHVLTQHLGVFPEEFILEPYVDDNVRLQEGDIFLLCSDGLTDMADDERIQSIIEEYKDELPKIIVGELVREALWAGGKDNVSVIIIKITQ